MRLRGVLLTTVFTAGWLVIACNGTTDRITAPTSPPSAGDGSATQGRETPPPTTPQPTPPPVDRGPIPPAPPPVPPSSASCDAAKAQWAIGERAIGERASAELLERARISAAAGTARFLRPNQRITLEYLGSRLNLGLNEQDVVRSVTCG
jgi:hypothetical protein